MDRLVELGHEVVVVDDLSANEGRSVNPGATLIEGSVTDLELVTSATKGADCVFHTAAWARVGLLREGRRGGTFIATDGWW